MPLTLSDRVCIVWRDDPKSAQVKTLTYKPERKIRTYVPDAIDPRAGEVPVIRDPDEIVSRLKAANPDTRIAVPIGVAMSLFGWKLEDFYVE